MIEMETDQRVSGFVAAARMYRGTHHPLDVAGGAVVGIAAARHVEEIAERAQRYALAARRLRRRRAEETGAETRSQTLP